MEDGTVYRSGTVSVTHEAGWKEKLPRICVSVEMKDQQGRGFSVTPRAWPI